MNQLAGMVHESHNLKRCPSGLALIIQLEADQGKMSLNKTAIRLIEEQTEHKKGKKAGNIVPRPLAGAWTKKETLGLKKAQRCRLGPA